MLRATLILLLLIWSGVSVAQLNSNYRNKRFTVAKNVTYSVDTLSIVAKSVIVTDSVGKTVDSLLYRLDYTKAQLTWKGADSSLVTLKYQVYPILFAKTYFHKDVKQLDRLAIDNSKYYIYKPDIKQNTLFSLPGLNKSGSISRGVMFGNNQNLSVNSNMVLQMAGKIGNDIEILAAISDDNLPIQPEGNTQQLNDFDRVFVQIKKDSTILTAGDYELKRPDSYFMNFYKRTQGAMLSHKLITKEGVSSSTTLALAVAKGRSARNAINGQEGNQGPYRLTGNNGENYIVVIAGTERIYIDGILLTRGQENDYVIDYNTAEITFTAKQLINMNSRISVEFEYSDKNYARSLNYLNQKFEYQKLAFRLNYYNEKDNRNQPFLQTLSDEQKQFLASLGKNVTEARYPNVSEVAFNENEILYASLLSAQGVQYYQYATNPQIAKYRVGFSYVGEGKGNYKIDTQSAANGRVYIYVAPLAGVMQGNYEPVSLLITPKQQQLITVGLDYKPKTNSIFSSEFAVSNNNVNLFADKSDANTKGYGLKLDANYPFAINKNGLQLKTLAKYEYASATFKPIERYRAVEFNRDFNLDAVTTVANEHLFSAGAQLFKSSDQNIGYTLNIFNRTKQYEGYLHQLNGLYKKGKYGFKYDGSVLNTNAMVNSGAFIKQFFDFNRELASLFAGVSLEQQKNKTEQTLTNELLGNSFSYHIYKVYLHSKSSQSNRFKADYSFRQDQLPKGASLINSSNSQTANLGIELTKNANSQLNLTAGYRKTNYENGFSNVVSDENLVGRVDYNLNALKGFVNTSVYYEVGNGQEPRREMTYLEVLPGQGVYAWIDYNSNGIKELDEFEISRFPDQAKFIRIFTAGTNYVRTNFTGVNQSLRLTPGALLKSKHALSRFVSRFTNQLSYKIDRKILAGTGLDVYNPFNTSIAAEDLIALSSFFRNTLFFNRNNPKFGVDFNYLTNGNKSFLSNGFDSRMRSESGIRIRTAPGRSVNINFSFNKGNKNYSSEIFTQRNFDIQFIELVPEFNYQYNTDLRITFSGIYGFQENDKNLGAERNTNIVISSETRYNVLKKGVLTAKISFINNNFVGGTNSTIGYEMLNGLQTGNNYTWGLGLQRTIGNGVQMGLNYEGRKSETVNVVHTGSMQVRAFF